MGTLVITIIVLIIVKFFYDKIKQSSKIRKEGGMLIKYSVLINKIIDSDSRLKINNVFSDKMTLGFTSGLGGSTQYYLTATFEKISVQWKIDIVHLGKFKLEWDFQEYDNQLIMFEQITDDIRKYLMNIFGQNKSYETVGQIINNYLRDILPANEADLIIGNEKSSLRIPKLDIDSIIGMGINKSERYKDAINEDSENVVTILFEIALINIKTLNQNYSSLVGEGIVEGLIFNLTLIIGFLKNESKKSESYISLFTSKYIEELVICKNDLEIDYSAQNLKNIFDSRLKYYTSLIDYFVKTQNRHYVNNQLYYLFYKNPLSFPKMTNSIELYYEIGANNIAPTDFIDNINRLILNTNVQLSKFPGI